MKAALGWEGELIFTSGASEALSLAITRCASPLMAVSAVEHEAVLRWAGDAVRLPVAAGGLVHLPDALAGLVAKDKVGFVGGMEIPLIKKFEAGFRAGVKTTNPKASVLVQYTGSFDNVAHGKQAAQDRVSKGCEVVFHAAGSDGNGVIQAIKEARAAGKTVYVIGVDSDQSHLAPDAVLTSMVKRVDLAVWQASADLKAGTFTATDVTMGLKEGGVTYAPVRVDFPEKAAVLAKVEALREKVVAGKVKVPSNVGELDAFVPPEL